MTGRSHPDNDVSIMNCSTCGHLPNAHAVAEAENHKKHSNDAFEWAQYVVALQRYSQGMERAPHDAKLRSNRAAVYMQLKQYQQVGGCVSTQLEIHTHCFDSPAAATRRVLSRA
jgi:hypothetical protein